MEYFTYFKVSKETTIEDVKKQWRELSKKYHPDTITDEKLKDEYTEHFKKMQIEYKKAMHLVGKKAGLSPIEITSIIFNEMEKIFPDFEVHAKAYLAEIIVNFVGKTKFIAPAFKLIIKPIVKKGIEGFNAKKFIEDLKKEKEK